MPLYRSEFNKTIIRLKLLRAELAEKGLTNTVQALSETILFLDKTDSIYIQELAEKHAQANNKIFNNPSPNQPGEPKKQE